MLQEIVISPLGLDNYVDYLASPEDDERPLMAIKDIVKEELAADLAPPPCGLCDSVAILH